jgi:hypothetical protein
MPVGLFHNKKRIFLFHKKTECISRYPSPFFFFSLFVYMFISYDVHKARAANGWASEKEWNCEFFVSSNGNSRNTFFFFFSGWKSHFIKYLHIWNERTKHNSHSPALITFKMHAIWRGSRNVLHTYFFVTTLPNPHFTQTVTLKIVGSNKKWPEKITFLLTLSLVKARL